MGIRGLETGEDADLRHEAWHRELHWRMDPVDQSMCGLCLFNQGNPKMRGCCGERMRWKVSISVWLPDKVIERGTKKGKGRGGFGNR